MRKGFSFYASYWEQMKFLDNDQKAELLNAICSVQFLEEHMDNIIIKDNLVNIIWSGIKHSVSASLNGYLTKTNTLARYDDRFEKIPKGQVEEKEKEKEQYVYTKKEFLQDWNRLRAKHLKKPSHLNSITFDDDNLLNKLSKDNNRDDFTSAMVGLFKQKKMPNDNTTMQSNPSHFLKFFNSYLTAFHDTNDMLYGKKDI